MSKVRNVCGHPVVIMVLLVATVFFILNHTRITEMTDDFDIVLFYVIAGISWFCALTIVLRTRREDWTLLGAGLLGHFLAVGMVYFLSVWYQRHNIDSRTDELLILARSLLIASGLLVVNGLVKEWCEERGFYAQDVLRHPVQSVKRLKKSK